MLSSILLSWFWLDGKFWQCWKIRRKSLSLCSASREGYEVTFVLKISYIVKLPSHESLDSPFVFPRKWNLRRGKVTFHLFLSLCQLHLLIGISFSTAINSFMHVLELFVWYKCNIFMTLFIYVHVHLSRDYEVQHHWYVCNVLVQRLKRPVSFAKRNIF